jgi:RHS repeat-associated protein
VRGFRLNFIADLVHLSTDTSIRTFNSATNLYYYRARYYDPANGRFLSEDPVNFYGGFNFYLYDDNDPADFTDPWGLYPDDYNVDLRNHGAPHIDRVDRSGNLVGRYRPDGSGIPHKGKAPPRIPNRDKGKFDKAADELRKKTNPTKCESAEPPASLRPDPTRIPWSDCHPYLNCYIGEDGQPHRIGASPSLPPALPVPGVPITLPSLPPLPIPEPILVPIPIY